MLHVRSHREIIHSGGHSPAPATPTPPPAPPPAATEYQEYEHDPYDPHGYIDEQHSGIDGLADQMQGVSRIMQQTDSNALLTLDHVKLDPHYYGAQNGHYSSEYDDHIDPSAGYYLPPQPTFTRQPVSSPLLISSTSISISKIIYSLITISTPNLTPIRSLTTIFSQTTSAKNYRNDQRLSVQPLRQASISPRSCKGIIHLCLWKLLVVIGGNSGIGIRRFIELLMRALGLHMLCEGLKVSNQSYSDSRSV